MASSPVTAADYRGEVVEGKRWRRACRVTILNPYGGTPTVLVDEEEVTEIEGVRTAKPTQTLTLSVNLADTFPVIDPTTGQPAGATMSQQDVYVALYSVYMKLAAERDQQEQQG